MKKFVFGNWKMNMLKDDIKKWKEDFFKEIGDTDFSRISVSVFVPFTHINFSKKVLSDTQIDVGAQNMYFEEKGAFTGEISPLHLKDIEIKKVLIGHSERRKIFKEDDELLAKKLKKACDMGFEPVFCIGETLEQREKGETEKVLETQLSEGLKLLSKEEIGKIIIAYEPVWAIGTGKVATPEQAVSAHKFIIEFLDKKYGAKVPVLYGGSIKPENFDSLVKNEEISGGLVGGSSLKGDSFAKLVKIALNYTS